MVSCSFWVTLESSADLDLGSLASSFLEVMWSEGWACNFLGSALEHQRPYSVPNWGWCQECKVLSTCLAHSEIVQQTLAAIIVAVSVILTLKYLEKQMKKEKKKTLSNICRYNILKYFVEIRRFIRYPNLQ